MSSLAKAPRPAPALPSAAGVSKSGIRISVTNQRGQRYQYLAQAVSLSMKRSALEIVENEPACFVWFDECNVTIRDGVRKVIFRLATGAASSRVGADLVILAELAPSGAPALATLCPDPSHPSCRSVPSLLSRNKKTKS